MKQIHRASILGSAALVLCNLLSGCEVLGGIVEAAASVAADENAKRADDPAAYAACDKTFNICKASGGFGTSACEEQRSILVEEGIYCLKAGVTTGSRGR